ncbi:MAG: DUF2207 domain-containing protein [Candidatus Omnitrophota bacterium]
MKHIFAAILSVSILLSCAASHASERILSYDSRIEVHKDSSLAVTETIKVIAEGAQIKSGIYRDFPTKYKDEYTVGFNIISVKRDGTAEAYHTQAQPNGIRVYIGKSDVFIPYGEHTYEISYNTDRQLGYFEDHDELYWNVTGNGWAFPIDQATATVVLPEGIPENEIKMDGFTGPQGSKARELNVMLTHGRPYFITNAPLRSYEGLTIVVGWPKGFVEKPIGSHMPVPTAKGLFLLIFPPMNKIFFSEALILLLVVYYIAVWAKVGRDPEKGVIVPLFAPPKGVSPAACRYISKMGFDNKALTAALVSAAVKGCITIIEEKRGEFAIKRVSKDVSLLSGDEKKAVEWLLKLSDYIKLEQTNHADISTSIDRLKDALRTSYEKVYFLTNTQYFIPGAVISFVILVLAAFITTPGINPEKAAIILFVSVWISGWTAGVVGLLMAAGGKWKSFVMRGGRFSYLGEAIFLSFFAVPFIFFEIMGLGFFTAASSLLMPVILFELIFVNILFYHLLKARTLAGRAVMDSIEGFRMYLATAEKDEIRAMGAPAQTPQLFEKYLPYAIALDVENIWAEKLTDVLSKAGIDNAEYSPRWYSGTSYNRFGMSGFASAMGSSLSSTISSSSTAPGSSSGFSGGGGGGGSSGGGGGGGGGGGW